MRARHYILDEHGEPKPATVLEWGEFFENPARELHRTDVGDDLISTIFLGLDPQPLRDPPLLWETLVFGNAGAGRMVAQRRYASKAEAELGHLALVARALEATLDQRLCRHCMGIYTVFDFEALQCPRCGASLADDVVPTSSQGGSS